ncbi:TPA: thioesterase family protein [Klebsiella aerogenes]|uniref:acyl-CoA thioesterase n=1 Tax=Enterobacteriaceae TaxID=543 RepID=UPI0015E8000C|nr:thioesterase family protein [Enterobacter roggenkampii]MBA2155697.1 acyl-CoA thioesterase [Enterobacter roggenkampii]HBR1775421.1 thioesterase family protein [Klebsiella pneumoniae]HDT6511598.1 thioesterase family protein [Klebsiella aerogenes]
MFSKMYEVDEDHIDFQEVVDGLYYPFYMEWARHAFMKEALGIDIEEEFSQGRIYMVLEYTLRFRQSLKKGDRMEVTCQLEKNVKRNRVNFYQQIRVEGVICAEATFTAACLFNGRPSMPEAVMNALAF